MCGGAERVGFPPGVADKMVMQTYSRYKEQHAAAPSRADLERELERKNSGAPPADRKPAATAAAPQAPPRAAPAAPVATPRREPEPEPAPASAPEPAPAPRRDVEQRQEPMAPYNGAREEGYSWAQTAADVTVQLFVPKGTRAKDLDVRFRTSRLSVGLKAGDAPMLDGELFEKVAVDECTWSLEVSNGELTITMEKAAERWWKSVLVGQGATEIDTTKVDSVKSIDEYDGETQGAIRKIMWEQDQKAKGLKTPEEQSQEEMLRQAWDAPGSPFAGQPFDPSAVNWGSGGGAAMGGGMGMPAGGDDAAAAAVGAAEQAKAEAMEAKEKRRAEGST